jgi:Reverse transcriptase (RNA-dependent DNA polymerase)
MNKTLGELLDNICVVYLNDILVYSSDLQEHNWHICLVLKKLYAYRLYIKLSKCKFNKEQVDFLGYIVSSTKVFIEND